MQVKLIWSNNDFSETWTISHTGQENNGPASLYRQSRPGQGYKDKIRTFLAASVAGSSRWRMVAVGALASRPIMHHSWPTEEHVCSALAHYSICLFIFIHICVTREVKISLCVHAAFSLYRHTHSCSQKGEVCKCDGAAAQLKVVRGKTKGSVSVNMTTMSCYDKGWFHSSLVRI